MSQPLVAPRPWRLLIPEKQFPVIPGTNSLRVSFADLDLEKILAMKQIPVVAAAYFPEWLRALDGERIRISGYMHAQSKETDISEFLLMPEARITNFGAPIRVDEVIDVRLQKDSTTYQASRRYDVEGIFRIAPIVEDGELWGLYQLEDARLISD